VKAIRETGGSVARLSSPRPQKKTKGKKKGGNRRIAPRVRGWEAGSRARYLRFWASWTVSEKDSDG